MSRLAREIVEMSDDLAPFYDGDYFMVVPKLRHANILSDSHNIFQGQNQPVLMGAGGKQLDVPTNKVWSINSIFIVYVSSGTGGSRHIEVSIRLGPIICLELLADTSQIANSTWRYLFGPGLSRETSQMLKFSLSPLPPIQIDEDYSLLIRDKNEVDEENDLIRLHVLRTVNRM